jgi:hypothetical protein
MNILIEMSFVDLDFQVLITCGKKAIVVIVPATKPRAVIKSILIITLSESIKQLWTFLRQYAVYSAIATIAMTSRE